MPILKTLTKPNGAVVTFHKVVSIQVDMVAQLVVVQAAAWPTEQAHDAGLLLDWMWDPMTVPFSRLADVEQALLELDGSPFLGGTLVTDASIGLEGARVRKWAQIKAAREAAEFGGFLYDDNYYDSDMVSQSRIQGAAQMAQIASAYNQEFQVEWTLANNEVKSLSAGQMVEVGMALGAHITTQHGKGRVLREALNAATTLEEIDAIKWTN